MPSQKKSNPSEVYISNNRAVVQRSIVFRNTSGKDFVLKLVASSADAIMFPATVFRFPPASYRTIQFRVDSRQLHAWDRSSLYIKGFVLPVYSKKLGAWIERKNQPEADNQEAFHVKIVFSDAFCAPQTVINLPGTAMCIDSTDHPVDVEELDCLTAVNIEKDVVTAEPIGSLMTYVDEHRKNGEAKSCWLTDYICGGGNNNADEKEKSKKSCRSKSRRSNSKRNDLLEATPCGGSTIQVEH